MARPLIFNIQRFSIHDGTGVRTTVFFKGCPLRCGWCHNPESQSFAAEWLQYPERCVGCGLCGHGAGRPGGRPAEGNAAFAPPPGGCPSGAWEAVGRAYSVEALCSLLERDRIFYDGSGGGVTLSGGEPMAQDPAYVLATAKGLWRRGIPVNVDTCGYAPYENFRAVLPYVNTFLYDIKAVDPGLHMRHTGVSNELILENLRRLGLDGARVNLRVPVIPGVNQGEEMGRILRFAAENVRAVQVNLLPYHPLGQDKAARLDGRKAPVYETPTPEAMEALCATWRGAGFANVHIGG